MDSTIDSILKTKIFYEQLPNYSIKTKQISKEDNRYKKSMEEIL